MNKINVIVNCIISMVLAICAIYFVFEENLHGFIILTLVWLMISFGLYKIYYSKCVKNIFSTNIFWMINLFTMYLASGELVDENCKVYYVVILMVIIGLVMIFTTTDWNESKMMCSMIILCYVIFFMNYLIRIQLNDKVYGCIGYLVGVLVLFIAEYKKKEWDAGKIILCLIAIVNMWKGIGMFGLLFDRIVIIALAMPFFLFGIYRKNLMFKYTGGLLVFCYFIGNVPAYEKALVSLITLIILYYIVVKKDDKELNWLWLHVLSLIFVDKVGYEVLYAVFIDDFLADVLIYFIVTTFNVIMLYIAVKTSREQLVYRLVNLFAMVRGLIFMVFMPKSIIVLVATTIAFSVNTKRLWNKNKLISKMYLGLKWLIYAIFVVVTYLNPR